MKRKLILVDLNKWNANIVSICKFNLSFCKDWLFNKVIYFDSVTSQTKSNIYRTYFLWRKSHLQICFIPDKLTFIPLSLLLSNKLCCLLHLLVDICKGLLLDSLKGTASKMSPEFLEILLEISKVTDTKVKLKIQIMKR